MSTIEETSQLTFDVVFKGAYSKKACAIKLDEALKRHTKLAEKYRKRLISKRRAIIASGVNLTRAQRILDKLSAAGLKCEIRVKTTRPRQMKPSDTREFYGDLFQPCLPARWLDPKQFGGMDLRERKELSASILSEINDLNPRLNTFRDHGVTLIAEELISRCDLDISKLQATGAAHSDDATSSGSTITAKTRTLTDSTLLWNHLRYQALMEKRIALCLSMLVKPISVLPENMQRQLDLSITCYKKLCNLNDRPLRLWIEAYRYQSLRKVAKNKDDDNVLYVVDSTRETISKLINEIYNALDETQENCGVVGHPDLSALPPEKATGRNSSFHMPLNERALQCFSRYEHTHNRVVSEISRFCLYVENKVFLPAIGEDLNQSQGTDEPNSNTRNPRFAGQSSARSLSNHTSLQLEP